jgi:hypothetical protein
VKDLYSLHVLVDSAEIGSRVKQGRRTLSRHRTQSGAVRAAIRTAKHAAVDVVTHGRDGRIRSKDSYGSESPVLDREH